MDFLGVLIFIGIAYGGFKYITKPSYRIAMTDPITGYRKYLCEMDGIGNKFNYSSDPSSALIFDDGSRAERFMRELPSDINPSIEIRKYRLFWTKLARG